MVAGVAIMPTLPFFVTCAALLAVGNTTPKMGRSVWARKSSSAMEDTVPQAMTMAFRSKLRRKLTSCMA